MLQSGDTGALQWNRWKRLALPRRVDLELDDLNLDVVAHRVVAADRAIDGAAIVEAGVDISEEVGGGRRRADAVDLHLDRPLLGFEDDDGGRRTARGL